MKIFMSLVLGLFSLVSVAGAQAIPTLDFFHGRECPHCQNQKKWFPELKKAYPDIVINEYEVWHDVANQALWAERLAEFDMEPRSVPTNIIGDQVITGFVSQQILAALEENYGPPAVDIALEGTESGPADYTWILIVLAGLGLAGAAAWFGKKS